MHWVKITLANETVGALCYMVSRARLRRHSSEKVCFPALSLDEILDVSADRCGCGVGKRRFEAFVDVRDDRRDRGVSGLDAGEDRGFARAAMLEERTDKTLRLLDRPAMPRPINFIVASQEFFERSHVMAHRAIRGRDDRGRPGHDMIARKQSAFLRQGEGLMVHCVAGCLDTDEREIFCLDRIASRRITSGA